MQQGGICCRLPPPALSQLSDRLQSRQVQPGVALLYDRWRHNQAKPPSPLSLRWFQQQQVEVGIPMKLPQSFSSLFHSLPASLPLLSLISPRCAHDTTSASVTLSCASQEHAKKKPPKRTSLTDADTLEKSLPPFKCCCAYYCVQTVPPKKPPSVQTVRSIHWHAPL